MSTRILQTAVLVGASILAVGMLPKIAVAQQNQQDQSAPTQTPSSAPRQRMHGQRILQELNLTEDQQAQIKKIHQDAKMKMDAVNADSSLTDADKQAKIRAIHRASMKQIHAVLTPEQREQLREKVRERRAARQQQQPS